MDLTSPLPFRHQREVHMPKRLEIPSLVPDNLQNSDSEIQPEPAYPRSNSLPSPVYPPRSPLPPHKLAKLANALGVNTPMPAFFRSPSPSGSSSFRTPSRYLLHIVPPTFLPSDDDDDDGRDPDGASTVSASSYRSQFRRGTLIPLYPSLQSQLGAIAREYNLPSTGGVVLYLVQAGSTDGPRISDDVWKLLWHKALQAERQDSQPRTAGPLSFRSGRSTPSSPFNTNPAARERAESQNLPSSTNHPAHFPYPSPSTSSTPSSEVHLPLSEKDNASASTPDLSLASDFTQNPFLPILAKVEFDIDRRKATWYNSWAHTKRERSRWRNGPNGTIPLELSDRSRSRSRRRFQTSASTASEDTSEYALLDDGEGENTAVDEDEQDQDTVVFRLRDQDPLADVFGNDAATWNEMRQGKRDPSYPDLTIPAGGDDIAPDLPRDEDEVVKLWEEKQRPTLSLDPMGDMRPSRKGAPPPLTLAVSPNVTSPLHSPAPATAKSPQSGLPYLNSASVSGGSPSGNFNEKRTKRRTGMVFGDLEVKIVAEPDEMTEDEISARSSQIIMKHKLDQLEKQLAHLSPRQLSSSPPPVPPVPEFDPLSALRSAPPGVDKFNISPSRHAKYSSYNPSLPSSRQGDDSTVIYPPRKGSLTALQHLNSPIRLREHRRGQGSQSSSSSSSKSHSDQLAWPAVPRTSPNEKPSSPGPASRANGKAQDRSPPQLTLKRASGAAQKALPVEPSEETKARMLDDDQDVFLPTPTTSRNPDSPVIPLSPDPFGKRPVEDMRTNRISEDSTVESRPPSRLKGTVLPSAVPEEEAVGQSSRFSADSEHSMDQLSIKSRRSRSNSIMSVRSLRNLWRKSNAPGKVPPLPSDLNPPALPSSSSASSSRPISQHSRGESIASQRSNRPTTERARPVRPDSGSDPFQFDNANIYKSPSSSSLASTAPSGPNYGSIGHSKSILKSWTGTANPPDAETRKLRPQGQRTGSNASGSMSEAEPSPLSPLSSSPPGARRGKITPSSSMDPLLQSNSLPTDMLGGLSRYPNALPPTTPPKSTNNLQEGSTPVSTHSDDFEMVSPPPQSASFSGTVS